jgi:hypothetical protein
VRSPDAVDQICVEGGVAAHEGQTFREGLRGEEAVEGIPVQEGEARNQLDVLQGDVQEAKPIRLDLRRDQVSEGPRKGQLPKADLDADLPQARNAQENLGIVVLDASAGFL